MNHVKRWTIFNETCHNTDELLRELYLDASDVIILEKAEYQCDDSALSSSSSKDYNYSNKRKRSRVENLQDDATSDECIVSTEIYVKNGNKAENENFKENLNDTKAYNKNESKNELFSEENALELEENDYENVASDDNFKENFYKHHYKCEFCDEHFDFIFDYLDHQIQHDNQATFKCISCNKVCFSLVFNYYSSNWM